MSMVQKVLNLIPIRDLLYTSQLSLICTEIKTEIRIRFSSLIRSDNVLV